MAHAILLVEDDPVIQSLSKSALEEAGFAVEACGTVADALKAFSKKAPDLVLLDIGLPDGTGFDICRGLGLGEKRNLPFIFLTAKGDIKTRLEGFKLGACDYIQKPFAVEELFARVRVHLRLKHTHDELSRRNLDLEIRERLRQDLTDMILHDLRTPAASIKGTLEIVANRGLISEGDASKFLRQAESAAEFMLLMLNDLLDVSQADQIGLRPETSEVGLGAVLKKATDLFENRCRRNNVSLRVAYSGQPRTLVTDPGLLFRILANLLSNAINASAAGQEIILSCVPAGAAVRFAVSDRGPGVPAAIKARIFEKYVASSQKDAAEGRGRGIGLNFCRLASRALGGAIRMEDNPGGGSVFICEVPARIGTAPHPA
ncbi:MAG: response regulator [Elusimicrobia bacterium]|nr:response regulator [Elusimicrobiota bacterium]